MNTRFEINVPGPIYDPDAVGETLDAILDALDDERGRHGAIKSAQRRENNMSIDQVILWVQNELRNAQTDLLAAEHTKDDVRFAVALRKLEALQEIETILNSVKGGDIA